MMNSASSMSIYELLSSNNQKYDKSLVDNEIFIKKLVVHY